MKELRDKEIENSKEEKEEHASPNILSIYNPNYLDNMAVGYESARKYNNKNKSK